MAQAAMASRDTSVSELCKELGVTPVTLYRYVDPMTIYAITGNGEFLYQRAHELFLFWDAKLFHSGSNSGTP